jgi:hypothetical protein
MTNISDKPFSLATRLRISKRIQGVLGEVIAMLRGRFATQLYGAVEANWRHLFRAGAATQRKCRDKY